MFFLMYLLSFSCLINNNFPKSEVIQITETIHSFAKAADDRNFNLMQEVLHDDFRAIVNQLFDSKEVSITDKKTYLNLLKNGIIGGDKRDVIILSMDIEDKNAHVKAKLIGHELKFTTFLQLVQIEQGVWKVISDMPVIEKAN